MRISVNKINKDKNGFRLKISCRIISLKVTKSLLHMICKRKTIKTRKYPNFQMNVKINTRLIYKKSIVIKKFRNFKYKLPS